MYLSVFWSTFRARGYPGHPHEVPSAPGLVFRWILGGILGPLGHPLGANGTHNAAQNRRERLTEAVLEEV